MKRSAIAGRAGCWRSCICRWCGSTAEAEIAGDSGCLCPWPPSISEASPASGAAVRPGPGGERQDRSEGLDHGVWEQQPGAAAFGERDGTDGVMSSPEV